MRRQGGEMKPKKQKRKGYPDYFGKLSVVMVKLAPEYDIVMAGIFGSLANGEFGPKSDIDILVRFRISPGFVKFIQLENELGRVLRRKVDLVTESSLSPHFRNDVLKQLKVVYEEK